MRDNLLDRIFGEYQAYKVSVLSLSNAEIFSKCYEIDIMTNLHDILADQVEKLSDDVVVNLLGRKDILADLYDGWLKRDDSIYSEIEDYMQERLGRLKTSKEKERDLHGTESNKASQCE